MVVAVQGETNSYIKIIGLLRVLLIKCNLYPFKEWPHAVRLKERYNLLYAPYYISYGVFIESGIFYAIIHS